MANRVNTATLIRGDTYTLRHPDSTAKDPLDSLRFHYGVPVIITDKRILEILENLHDLTVDGDGEEFEKPRFRIDRNVAPPNAETNMRTPTRLKADRPVRRRARRG